MPNFFKSFFSGKSETPESEKQKNDQKNFEIFKYDGLRAQRMGRPDYAIFSRSSRAFSVSPIGM